jgi:hypothetical protein
LVKDSNRAVAGFSRSASTRKFGYEDSGCRQREFLDLAGYGDNLRPNLTGQPFKTDITAVSATSYRDINPNAFTRPPKFRTQRIF